MEELDVVFRLAVADFLKVYIVIDALDESPQDQRRSLLNYLAVLGPAINVMLTSRPHITLFDTCFPNVQSLDILATPEDIQLYIGKRIQESSWLSKHINVHPELQEEIVTKILSSFGGM